MNPLFHPSHHKERSFSPLQVFLLTLFFTSLLAFSGYAQSESDFTFDPTTGTITGYTGATKDIVIPATIGGVKVTTIGFRAFEHNSLTSVTFTGGVTTIGEAAFYDNQLTSVILSESLVVVGSTAFSNNQISSIAFPAGLRTIGFSAFSDNQLTSVILPKSVVVIELGSFINNNMVSFNLPPENEKLPQDYEWEQISFFGSEDNKFNPGDEVSSDFGYEIDDLFDISFSIAYELNGGANASDAPAAYNFDTEVTLPVPTKIGHSFEGWYSDVDFSGDVITSISATTIGDQMFYAKWVANEYGISYELNDGENAIDAPTSYTYGIELTLPTPTKVGHSFEGWYDNADFSGEASTAISNTALGDQTFYAKWTANEYAISYELNDGENAIAAPTSYTYGIEVTLPTPTKVGHTFEGWYTASDFSGDVITSISATTLGDQMFYAKWTANEYVISYELNDGENAIAAPTSYTYGIELTLPTPTKVGHTFEGWFADADFSGDVITSISTTALGDQMFYAKWTANEYAISYELNDGENAIDAPTSYTYGIELTLPTPTKVGHSFEGWFSSSDLSGDVITSISTTTIGDQMFYAKWTANEYVISYELNDGENAIAAPTSYTYGIELTLPTPTKVGHTFEGWFADADFSGDVITSISTTALGDQMFYAKWTANEYAISYELNDGENAIAAPTSYTYGIELTLPTPTKVGHSFEGWYAASDFSGDVITAISNTTLGDQTFYAKWTANEYAISYELNGGENASDAPISYTYSIELTLPTPTKIGHSFEGWYADADLSGEVSTVISNGTIGDQTFYAKWMAMEYTISYVLNGGENASDAADAYTYGTEVTLPIPTKVGHTFEGWYADADFSGDAITAISSTTTGDQALNVKWMANEYAISYELNDGDNAIDGPTSYTYGIEVTLPTPTKVGYSFEGWFAASDLSGEASTVISNGTIGDQTFYAKWMAMEYTISYVLNGGENASDAADSYTYGTGVTLATPEERDGYTFAGWYSDVDFSGDVITAISTTTTGDQAFYAKWTGLPYAITYELNGGENDPDVPSFYTYGTALTLPVPTKTGHSFEGWFLSSDLSGEASTVISNGTIGDQIFYAKWMAMEYTISYVLNGGANASDAADSYTYGTGVTLATPEERDGYTFEGWYADAEFSGDAITAISTTTTGDQALYARWVAIEYTISYELNGGENTSVAPTFYTYGTSVTLPIPTKAGHSFEGWYADADFSGDVSTVIGKTAIGDQTFYAKWERILSANEGLQQVKVYPNPASHILHIELSDKGGSDVRLINQQGAVVLSDKLHDGTASVHIASLPTGLYFVQVFSENKWLPLGKVMKQ
ncbi:InlB B-repeat-containing protein [Persicobacter psychrovividus]|uniref:Secretion system C-terminal sorting domain-containing protein n=1 Tax=Persicobacter psychrovividus TaxID=387638 RepID=A0ABM7VJR7_9BACT|nr:hypothetical protein PEPS_34970 [Persicobacter psychrovividus]